MEVSTRLHCKIRVVPTSEGICPSCRKTFRAAPHVFAPATQSNPPTQLNPYTPHGFAPATQCNPLTQSIPAHESRQKLLAKLAAVLVCTGVVVFCAALLSGTQSTIFTFCPLGLVSVLAGFVNGDLGAPRLDG